MQHLFEYSPAVKKAFAENRPVLALESTIISHGMPFPENLETAKQLEQIALDYDVTPATIAIMHGKIKIGLSEAELDSFAQDKKAIKASKRDLPYALSQNISAGTTVAATLFCAARAGIKVFATGGIGGVHRGEANDISADLIELARTPVSVVCAGAKAIFDLPRTLEFLETHSVPVIGYRTSVLPAFYTPTTSYPLSITANTISELAAMIQTHHLLGYSSGNLIVNPIPDEFGISAEIIEPVIHNAVRKASELGISGKDITPFLLKEIATVTQGQSLRANIALVKNNVELGAQLAKHLAKNLVRHRSLNEYA